MNADVHSQPSPGPRRRTVVGLALLALVIGLALALGAAHADARTPASGVAAAGILDLRADLSVISQRAPCPPGVTASGCAGRIGKGLVPGLGSVSEAYTFQFDYGPCAESFGQALGYPVRLVVAGKGEFHVTLAEGAECVEGPALIAQAQAFTVTGGTGIYAGASGSGMIQRGFGEEGPRGHSGIETWRGTLSVPTLEFDTTPPTVTGAVAKTVQAPRGARRVRVTYSVTASDDVDGTVPVSCTPKSGSRFNVGRTVVTCSATDTSANTQTARFAITVKARR